MVAKLLLAEQDLNHFKGDTFDDHTTEIKLPKLNIFDAQMSHSVATDKQDSLDLQKVLENLKDNPISDRHLADQLYNMHILTENATFFQIMLSWMNLAFLVFAT